MSANLTELSCKPAEHVRAEPRVLRRARRQAIDWDRVLTAAATFRDGVGDGVLLVLALAPAAAGFALMLAAFGLIRI